MSQIDSLPFSELLQLFQELETAWPILCVFTALILRIILKRYRTTQYYVLTSTFGDFHPQRRFGAWLTYSAVLVFYDYLLTLPLEIAQIWHGQWTGIKILFLLNRYPYLLSQLMGLLYIFLYTSDAVRLFFRSRILQPSYMQFRWQGWGEIW